MCDFMSFRDFILKFCDDFNAEKRVSGLLEEVNKRNASFLKTEVSELVCTSALMCRFHVSPFRQRHQSLAEIAIPLKPVKPASMSQCLKVFEKSGQKDNFLIFMEYVTAQPNLFAQALYLFLGARGRDCEVPQEERRWMCFATFPATFNFLLCDVDQKNAFTVVTDMIRLHFYLHGPKFSMEHWFLNDVIFSCFLALNPGPFFDNAVLPLVPGISVSVTEREFQYLKHDSLVTRAVYWRHIARFVDRMFQRMKDAIPLLPPACRTFIRMIDGLDLGEFPKRHYLIFDLMFRSYLAHFVEFGKEGLGQDICLFVRCCYPEQFVETRMSESVEASLMKNARASLDNFLNLLVVDPKIVDSQISDGIDIGGRHTLITPLDLSLLYRCFMMFRQACGDGKCPDLENSMKNLTDLKVKDNDTYMLFKHEKGGSSALKVKVCDTGEIEQLVNAMDYLKVRSLPFTTAQELIQQINCFGKVFLDPAERVKLGLLLIDTTKFSAIMTAIKGNNFAISAISDRLASGLYYVTNERRRNTQQIRKFSDIYITRVFSPSLAEYHPREFTMALDKFGSVLEAVKNFEAMMGKLVEWINPLGLTPENVLAVKQGFFWKYADKIELVFKVQDTVDIEKATLLVNEYAQLNRSVVQGVQKRRMKKLGQVVQNVQNVKNCQKLRDNAYWAIHAIDVIQMFDDNTVAYGLAMSGNGEIFCFHRMMKVYILQSDFVMSLLFTDQEQKLLNRFIDVMDILEKFGQQKGLLKPFQSADV